MFFHCMIKSTFEDWFVSFIQEPHINLEKPKFWDEMKNMGHKYNGPWKIMGDFNEVLEKQEKWGGENYNPKKAKYTLEFMDNMRMFDLGTIGPKSTWSNKRKGLPHI